MTGVSKTITQNDKNTPKPADNPWLDQSRSIGTTGEKFWMCSSCGIGKRDTYALCLQDCHFLGCVLTTVLRLAESLLLISDGIASQISVLLEVMHESKAINGFIWMSV